MSLIRNTAGQFLYAVLVNKNDGSAITAGATLEIAKDGAAPTVAEAVLSHQTNGLWEAALSQADSNGEILGYVWAGPNVVPQGGTVVTVEYDREAIDEIQASLAIVLAWIAAGGGGVPPSGDDPCAQNPAQTRGPTTEPLPVIAAFSKPIRLTTNNH
jgi:hypothetical protein